jgi:antitoxin component YwqK of YwqJK toxin-antitoxin module
MIKETTLPNLNEKIKYVSHNYSRFEKYPNGKYKRRVSWDGFKHGLDAEWFKNGKIKNYGFYIRGNLIGFFKIGKRKNKSFYI